MQSLERIGVGRAGTINLMMTVMTRKNIWTYLLLCWRGPGTYPLWWFSWLVSAL